MIYFFKEEYGVTKESNIALFFVLEAAREIIKTKTEATINEVYKKLLGEHPLLRFYPAFNMEVFVDPDDYGWDKNMDYKRLFETRRVRI